MACGKELLNKVDPEYLNVPYPGLALVWENEYRSSFSYYMSGT